MSSGKEENHKTRANIILQQMQRDAQQTIRYPDEGMMNRQSSAKMIIRALLSQFTNLHNFFR